VKILTFILFLLLLSANTFTAKVIGITDGDSITILTDQKQQIKVRLEGIDCPELHQDFGTRAKQVTSDLCFGKTVRVEQTGIDKYRRMLANVFVGDVSVNKELIRKGMAWHYKQSNHDSELAEMENQARRAKVGLWAQENPVPPWDWRHPEKKVTQKKYVSVNILNLRSHPIINQNNILTKLTRGKDVNVITVGNN
jgi:micrococcal nuclease